MRESLDWITFPFLNAAPGVVPATDRHVVEPPAATLVVNVVTKVAAVVNPATSVVMTLWGAVCSIL